MGFFWGMFWDETSILCNIYLKRICNEHGIIAESDGPRFCFLRTTKKLFVKPSIFARLQSLLWVESLFPPSDQAPFICSSLSHSESNVLAWVILRYRQFKVVSAALTLFFSFFGSLFDGYLLKWVFVLFNLKTSDGSPARCQRQKPEQTNEQTFYWLILYDKTEIL